MLRFEQHMQKINNWYLYDFANSFASSVIIFYYPLLLSRGGASDSWIGISAALSTLILLIFYPSLGHRADQSEKRTMWYLQVSSVLMFGALVAISIVTNAHVGDYTLLSLFALSVFYMIFQVAFQGSYVFYTSYMQQFENAGYNKDRISGFGMGLGQLGNAISIGIMGAFVVGGSLAIFDIHGKSLALLLGGLIFIVLAIPFLVQKSSDITTRSEKNFSLTGFSKIIFSNKQLFYYLVGYMLVADSIATFQIYLTLYLKNVFNFTDKMSSTGGVISLGMLFITCMVVGMFATKISNRNRLLKWGGALYVGAFIIFAITPVVPLYAYVSLAFAGIAYGIFFPLARSFYSDIVPKESQAEYFSSFVIFERAASIIGPLMWVTVFELLHSYSIEFRYRANLIVLSAMALLGLYFIKKAFKEHAYAGRGGGKVSPR